MYVAHDSMIRVCSFNCKNIKSSLPDVIKLCSTNDIIFLQETWLANEELHILCELDDKFYASGISAMDNTQEVRRGRPFGGVAILWRKELLSCKIVEMKNNRLICLQINSGSDIYYFVNSYMPVDCADNLDD